LARQTCEDIVYKVTYKNVVRAMTRSVWSESSVCL